MNSYEVQKRINTFLKVIGLFAFFAIIAAILYPVFAPAREYGGRNVSCGSNMKQLGIGLLQYCQDYDEQLPAGLTVLVDGHIVRRSGLGWAGQDYNYLKSKGVFRCPNDTPNLPNQISYAYNRNIARDPLNTDCTNPANTVVLFEVSGGETLLDQDNEGQATGATSFSPAGDGSPANLSGGSSHITYATGDIGKRPAYCPGTTCHWSEGRHTDGSNYLLADGHVKWFKPEQVSSGSNATKINSPETGDAVGSAAGTRNPSYQATFSLK